MGVTPTGLLGQNAPSHVGEGFRKGPGPVPTHPKRDTARTVVLSDHLKKRTSAIQMIAVSLRLKKNILLPVTKRKETIGKWTEVKSEVQHCFRR